jgi:uncharacterized membrane protein YgcG
MDEAGAALDHLEPGAVLTYAEAGGWGRAIMLEARRRDIATIGAQHGFIYRHWLNYLHEPDEMAPSPGNSADAGFPHPTCTLLFDGFAQEHLRRNGHFPDGSTVVTGSTRLEQFVRTAAALTPADREGIRREAGGGSTGRIVLVAAKHSQLGRWFRALVDAVKQMPDVRIVVKPHPAEGPEPYARDAAGMHSVFIAPPQADLARLTAVADIVVTANSTAAIEAMAIGVPSLVVGLPTNLSPFVDAGAMAGVSRLDDLSRALSHVINFDVPAAPDDYIHRVGRTARAEMTGDAFTFVSPAEEMDMLRIERAIGKRLPRITVPDFDYKARPEGRLELSNRERRDVSRSRNAGPRSARGGSGPRRSSGGSGGKGRPSSGQGDKGRPSSPPRPAGSKPPSRRPRGPRRKGRSW